MLGNDVIDLADPETQPSACHPRFDARVFGRGELARLARLGDGDATHLRWIFWAAKEAAYKAARACDPSIVFSPRRFQVSLRSADRAIVRHDGGAPFAIEIAAEPEYIHAVAHARSRPHGEVISVVQRCAGSDPSRAVRSLATVVLAPRLGVVARDLRIDRARGRPPVLRYRGGADSVAAALSLSHHGRFVAFACILPGAALERVA